jgi:hypothetical protein
MKEFLEFIVRPLVDHSEPVIVQDQAREDKITFTIYVAEQDVGKMKVPDTLWSGQWMRGRGEMNSMVGKRVEIVKSLEFIPKSGGKRENLKRLQPVNARPGWAGGRRSQVGHSDEHERFLQCQDTSGTLESLTRDAIEDIDRGYFSRFSLDVEVDAQPNRTTPVDPVRTNDILSPGYGKYGQAVGPCAD